MEICVSCKKKMVPAGNVTFYTKDCAEAWEFAGHYITCPGCGTKIISTDCNHTGFASHVDEIPDGTIVFNEDKL